MTREEKRAIVTEATERHLKYLCEGPVGDPEWSQKSDEYYWLKQVMTEREVSAEDEVFVLGYQPRISTGA